MQFVTEIEHVSGRAADAQARASTTDAGGVGADPRTRILAEEGAGGRQKIDLVEIPAEIGHRVLDIAVLPDPLEGVAVAEHGIMQGLAIDAQQPAWADDEGGAGAERDRRSRAGDEVEDKVVGAMKGRRYRRGRV